ncbi:cyclophilin-like fold protein [Xylocopilactobacillus apicola]|uniref:Cyclophilin-like domain-containing protein n=1 Tax=Xylocopilactobacillus apicola TaxID=2932184 RepID=A0AAU9DB16_9LACO|nr:cyclophilin-like fold protein [Xylocopilactobacillus apicola]BDR59621.1 hypothetical protein XA3_20620 [Xylocopilactobacillus apicola]
MKKIFLLLLTFAILCLPVSSVQAAKKQKQETPIVLTIKGHRYRAELNQSVPAKQLLKRLPLKLKFQAPAPGIDEKIADLKKPLSTKGTPVGADPNPGDIAYWSPDSRLVLYWGDVSYFDGIHLLGKFKKSDRAKAIKALRQQKGDLTVRIAKG